MKLLVICENKKQKWLESMVHFIQKANGLGEPAEEYSQNVIEYINSVLKLSKGNYKISLKETAQLIHNEVKLQEENFKLAIVAKGPCRMRTAYKLKLQVSEEYYCLLNSKQRKR